MSKYWPVVMWFERVEGPAFRYIPSWAHFRKFQPVPRETYAEALQVAREMAGEHAHKGTTSLFRPYVIEHEGPLELFTPEESATCVLLVSRIAVNEDGKIALNLGHTQEREDAA